MFDDIKPIAWAHFADNGNIRIWTSVEQDVLKIALTEGFELQPLYTQSSFQEALDRAYDMSMILFHEAVDARVDEIAEYFGREGDGRFNVDGNWIAKTIRANFSSPQPIVTLPTNESQ